LYGGRHCLEGLAALALAGLGAVAALAVGSWAGSGASALVWGLAAVSLVWTTAGVGGRAATSTVWGDAASLAITAWVVVAGILDGNSTGNDGADWERALGGDGNSEGNDSEEEDDYQSASDSNVKSKKASTSKTSSEGKAGSKTRTTKKPKFGEAGDEPSAGGVKVFKNTEGEKYVELGKKKRASVRSFKGQVYLDIREFYGTDGDEKPGKKGISLAMEQWESLKRSISVIDASFAELGKK